MENKNLKEQVLRSYNNNPLKCMGCGGAVTPAKFLFLDSKISSTLFSFIFPSDTSTAVPTIILTIL